MNSTSKLPSFSIIVPTRNRASLVAELLAALKKQRYPAELFEVIVVDNDSDTDETTTVVKKWQRKLRNLKYVTEHNQGASWSRNTGVRNASFKHFLFLDDDVHFSDQLLAAYAQAWLRYPTARILGGGVTPELSTGQPLTSSQKQTVKAYPWCFTYKKRVDQDQEILLGDFLYSANMSYRRHSREHQLFSTRLGVQLFQGEQFGGEDYELCARTQLRGEKVILLSNKSTEVRHRLSVARFNSTYIYRRHLWAGVEMAVIESELKKQFPQFRSFFLRELKSPTVIWQILTDRNTRSLWMSYWLNGRFFHNT